MKKWLIVFSFVGLNTFILKSISNIRVDDNFVTLMNLSRSIDRAPATDNKRTCLQVIDDIKYEEGFSISLYDRHKNLFDQGAKKPEEFETIEQYSAFIDSRVDLEGISVGEYLARDAKGILEKHYKTFLANKSMKGGTFFMSGDRVLENLLLKGLKSSQISNEDTRVLKKIYREKIAKEAQRLMDEQSDSLVGKLLDSNLAKIGFDVAGMAPLVLGLGPPVLKFDWIDLSRLHDRYGRFIKAKNFDLSKRYYRRFSEEQKRELYVVVYLNHYKTLYFYGVVTYYFALLGESIYDGLEVTNELVTHDDARSTDVQQVLNPSCEGVYRCINNYSDLWKNYGENSAQYRETKESCEQVASLNDC